MSTSCPALDYIVVDTTSAAQRCVELLRSRQLGVATFLILEKQQHLAGAAREKKQPPEGAWRGRLSGHGAAGRHSTAAAKQPLPRLTCLPSPPPLPFSPLHAQA